MNSQLLNRRSLSTTTEHFAFACLLYSLWWAVDHLVQVELTGEYGHSPIVAADNTLTLLKKELESGNHGPEIRENGWR